MPSNDERLRSLLAEVDDVEKARLLTSALEKVGIEVPTAFADSRATAVELQKHYEELLRPVTFQPGQLVTWKLGLKNKTRPKYGQPAIVMEVLETTIYDDEEEGAGSTYFREPLDIVIGLLDDEDGDFITFYFDSRRLQLVDFEESQQST